MNSLFKPELIQFASYKLLKLNIEDIQETDNSDEEVQFVMDNKAELSFNTDNKLIKTRLDISITRLASLDDFVVAKAVIAVEYVFVVQNFEELHHIDENDVLQIDQNLTDSIKAIAYSTTRGLLMDKFRDTSLDGIILPVIDPRKGLQDNAKK
ncbi:hypothetical protein [Sphingobacterium lumbrici]|uniref:hypothetical protein n=1 Tax=Sphingobacterium lumbrici TaxID=2559600 RepID=UPI00112EEBDA|nr:hypothetical protein [Sphingobacterium lumbrici]